MGEQRSLIGHLTLTAWESWSAEPHWKNAVIIAIVGSIAFSLSSPSATSSNSGNNSSVQNNYSPSYKPSSLNAPNSANSSSGAASLIIAKPKPNTIIKVKPSEQGGDIRKLKPNEKVNPSQNGSAISIKPSFKSGD